MAQILDLDVLIPEGLEIKIGEDIYEIPGNPKTKLVIQFMEFEDKLSKAKKQKEQVELFAEITALILNQDEKHEINKDFIIENFSLFQMQAIADKFMKMVQGIESNPNS